MRTGIFGGSFNPVHNGHINFAENIIKEAALDRIIFVPTCGTPLKDTPLAPQQDRVNMLKIAAGQNSSFSVSEAEIERGGISYTYQTVREFKKLYPNDDLFLIIGEDQFLNFTAWKNWREIIENASLCTALRLNSTKKSKLCDYAQNVLKIQKGYYFVASFEALEISSSQIRQAVKNGEEIERFVGKEVAEYIKERGLYLDI